MALLGSAYTILNYLTWCKMLSWCECERAYTICVYGNVLGDEPFQGPHLF